jgi:RNA polymerase sigma-70 factor (ECF subfamily)
MSENDDFSIVEDVRAGDTSAFERLVRAYQTRVVRYCLLLMRNPVDAEEAAQDVFVKAFQSIDQYKGDAAFLTWIGRIAHNHCMDILRKRSRQKTDSLDALLEANPTRGEERFAEPGAEDGGSEAADRVPAILGAMKADHREILMLREVQELSYEDIAKSLGITLDAVKSRLRRARAEFTEKAGHLLGRPRV